MNNKSPTDKFSMEKRIEEKLAEMLESSAHSSSFDNLTASTEDNSTRPGSTNLVEVHVQCDVRSSCASLTTEALHNLVQEILRESIVDCNDMSMKLGDDSFRLRNVNNQLAQQNLLLRQQINSMKINRDTTDQKPTKVSEDLDLRQEINESDSIVNEELEENIQTENQMFTMRNQSNYCRNDDIDLIDYSNRKVKHEDKNLSDEASFNNKEKLANSSEITFEKKFVDKVFEDKNQVKSRDPTTNNCEIVVLKQQEYQDYRQHNGEENQEVDYIQEPLILGSNLTEEETNISSDKHQEVDIQNNLVEPEVLKSCLEQDKIAAKLYFKVDPDECNKVDCQPASNISTENKNCLVVNNVVEPERLKNGQEQKINTLNFFPKRNLDEDSKVHSQAASNINTKDKLRSALKLTESNNTKNRADSFSENFSHPDLVTDVSDKKIVFYKNNNLLSSTDTKKKKVPTATLR